MSSFRVDGRADDHGGGGWTLEMISMMDGDSNCNSARTMFILVASLLLDYERGSC